MKIAYNLDDLPKSEIRNFNIEVLNTLRILEIDLRQISQYNFNLINQYHKRYLDKIKNGVSYGKLRNFNSTKDSHIITKIENTGRDVLINIQFTNTLVGIYLSTFTNEQLIDTLSVELDYTLENITIDFRLPK